MNDRERVAGAGTERSREEGAKWGQFQKYLFSTSINAFSSVLVMVKYPSLLPLPYSTVVRQGI